MHFYERAASWGEETAQLFTLMRLKSLFIFSLNVDGNPLTPLRLFSLLKKKKRKDKECCGVCEWGREREK